MEGRKSWWDLFLQESENDTSPPLKAMTYEDGKLNLKIPHEITNKMVENGQLSLVGKLLGTRPNIDAIRKWAKFRWKVKGSMDIITMPNNYMMFIFGNEEYKDYILISQ